MGQYPLGALSFRNLLPRSQVLSLSDHVHGEQLKDHRGGEQGDRAAE